MNCKNCGKEIVENSKICPFCGAVLEENVVSDNNQEYAFCFDSKGSFSRNSIKETVTSVKETTVHNDIKPDEKSTEPAIETKNIRSEKLASENTEEKNILNTTEQSEDINKETQSKQTEPVAMASEKKEVKNTKKGNGWKIATIIFVVIALVTGGIAFKVFSDYQALVQNYQQATQTIDEMKRTAEINNKKIADQEAKVKALNSTISDKDKRLEEITSSYNSLLADSKELANELLNIAPERAFYRNYAVIVFDDGTRKYHTYDCPDFGDQSFWIYNIEAAESKGYYACPKCH